MPLFLAIQNTYQQIQCALFLKNSMIDSFNENKIYASKKIIPLLNSLLERNKYTLGDISFIAVNQGPGPFTTLRTVIVTINGISFATGIPLIGIDGLVALLDEYHDPQFPFTVALLNAFGKDVYFQIQSPDKPKQTGCENIKVFLDQLKKQFPIQTIRFLGNGSQLYQQEIRSIFSENALFPSPIPHTCSIEQIGLIGWQKWQQKSGLTNKLKPLYLKQQKFHQIAS